MKFIITWNKIERELYGEKLFLWHKDFSASVIRRSVQSFLNQIFNHPICARSTFLYEKILLINFYIFRKIKSLPLFKEPFLYHEPNQTSVPAQVERCRNIPVGWWWEASNKVPGPCGEGYELLWSSYISKLLAELLQIAAISTPAVQSSADGVSARAQPHQSETAHPPEGSRGRAGGWGIIVSASGLIGKTSAGRPTGSPNSQHQCVGLTEEESHCWIIDWIWMQYWRSFNWKHLHVL